MNKSFFGLASALIAFSGCAGVAFSAAATTLYVAPTGSDSNTGEPPNYLKTISKAISLANPGDEIVVRGGTYREALSISKPNLHISANKQENVIVSGAEVVTGWAPYSEHIFVAQFPHPVSQVFANGQYLKLVQYPRSGYLPVDANSDNLSLSSQALKTISNRDLVGANVHVRTETYDLSTAVVTKFSNGNALSWQTKTRYPVTAGYGFYLDNQLWMFEQPGEWFYDKAAQKLYVWLPDNGDPGAASNTIEASVSDNTLQANNADGLAIDGLLFDKPSSYGILINNSKKVSLENTTVQNSGSVGIRLNKSDDFSFQGGKVINVSQTGIALVNSARAQILNSQFNNIGTVGSPKNTLAAIQQDYTSNGIQIIGNHIESVGYHGIYFKYNAVIKNNTIDHACMVFTDCGAIYTYGWHDAAFSSEPPFNSVLENNVISNTVGGADGIPKTVVRPAAGIYLDSLTHGVTVANNTLSDNPFGIFLNDPSGNTITGNHITGGIVQLSFRQTDNATKAASRKVKDNVVKNNQFIASSVTARALSTLIPTPRNHSVPIALSSNDDQIPNFATFEANQFENGAADSVMQARYQDKCHRWHVDNYTASEWQTWPKSGLAKRNTDEAPAC